MGKRIGAYKYIHVLPRDAYGNCCHIGGRILSQKFGLGVVIGITHDGGGRTYVICNFHATHREGGAVISEWHTWFVPTEEGVAIEVKEEMDVGAR